LPIRGSVRVSSLGFTQTAWLSANTFSTERLSERERTLNLAILAMANEAALWPQHRESRNRFVVAHGFRAAIEGALGGA
jgi:hypothetical protein